MRLHHVALASVIVSGAVFTLNSGCSGEDTSQLTSDPQATDEQLRRRCETEQDSEDWKERCATWMQRHARDAAAADAANVDASPPPPAPAPTPTTTTTTPPPPPPPPATCTSFTYSAWSACQSNSTQTRTVTSSSPAGCTGGTPVLTQACVYTAPIDGAALYTMYCANCHGSGKKGKAASSTQNAIDNNVGGMGSLKFLTPAQIAAIAAAP